MIFKKIRAKSLKTGMSLRIAGETAVKITDIQTIHGKVIAATYRLGGRLVCAYFNHTELVEVEAEQAAG